MISIHPKPKQSKGDTPLRQTAHMKGIQNTHKNTQFGGAAQIKQSQHLHHLKDNKQNMNPNVKERVKSQQNRQSPAKKILFVRNLNRHTPSPSPDQIQTKYSSSLQPKNQTNSALQTHPLNPHHQSQQLHAHYHQFDACSGYESVPSNIEYYNFKEDKVKVTLKEGKRKKSQADAQNNEDKHMQSGQKGNEQGIFYGTNIIGGGTTGAYANTSGVHSNSSHKNNSTNPSLSNQLMLSCPNHPEKEVKYFLLHGQSTPSNLPSYCCSKCAVSLVTQGYKVKEIVQEGEGAERGKRLRVFLGEVEHMQPALRDISYQLQQVKQIVEMKYQQHQMMINEYYHAMQTRIAAMHKQSLTTLKLYLQSSMDELATLQSSLQMHQNELIFLKEDITPNLPSIINTHTLSEEAFKVIMREHEDKIEKIAKEVDRIKKSRVIVGAVRRQIANDAQIRIVVGEDGLEIQRRKREDNREDPFRMSFGKETHSPSFSNNDVQ